MYCVIDRTKSDPKTGSAVKVVRVFCEYDAAADLFRKLEDARGWALLPGGDGETRFDLASFDQDTGRPGRLLSYVFD